MAERLIEIPTLKVKLLNPDAKLPTYAHSDDAGFDLYSPFDGTIKAGNRGKVPLGIAFEIPQGWVIFLKDKSGIADQEGLHVLAGVIDPGFRGECQVLLYNTDSNLRARFRKGEKIAQGVLLYAPQAKILQVEQLSETQRGEGGFGSTGKK